MSSISSAFNGRKRRLIAIDNEEEDQMSDQPVQPAPRGRGRPKKVVQVMPEEASTSSMVVADESNESLRFRPRTFATAKKLKESTSGQLLDLSEENDVGRALHWLFIDKTQSTFNAYAPVILDWEVCNLGYLDE
ncbi:hypothetical protein BD408DRAFT_447251 [Parasitella parasitica]|nr:hypothetical protein BD408DRAFT_447251 [Parasitella parasitica]